LYRLNKKGVLKIIQAFKYCLSLFLCISGLLIGGIFVHEASAAATDAWQGQYYKNDKFEGTPITKTHANLNLDWKAGTPDPSIPANYFSAKFVKEIDFKRGVYQLTGAVDDKIQVYIDDQLVYEINKAGHHVIDELIEVPVGKHSVQVKYVELTGNAKLAINFTQPEGWSAKYYDNNAFQGNPQLQIHDSEKLNHNWGADSPLDSIPVNNFSAEFEKDMTFTGGIYNLTGKVDDLVKVYIDNKLVYEMNKAGSHSINKLIEVPQGTHNIRVQYVEYTGAAAISLDFTKPEGWIGKYYKNTGFSGSPVILNHSSLNFDWKGGSPASAIPSNYFSATFEKEISFTGGDYYLAGRVDDAANVYIDGKLVYQISDAGNHSINKPINITAGKHRILVEYKEFTGGAALSLDFIKSDGWLAKYYNNENFKGTPIYKSTDKLNFNWSGGSPDKDIKNDYFSGEFVRNMDFEGGVYTLSGSSDDLIEIYIDDKRVYNINRAGNHTFNTLVDIPKGSHEIRVKYVELTGGARLSLNFERPQGWVAKYFGNTQFQGNPVIKEHSDLNLNWTSGSPASSIPSDNYSAKLVKSENFNGGIYKLVGQVDDLIKVYIDNKKVFEITQPGHHTINQLIEIPSGNHEVKIEYVELSGNARISLDFDAPKEWVAKYYPSKDFTGTPVLKEHDDINFNWGYESPDAKIPVNYFSATYEKSMSFDGGIYKLAGKSDDLVKVYIDNKLVYDINQAGSHFINEYLEISKGVHKVKYEYVELSGAAKFSVGFAKQTGWVAKYYDNTSLEGTPVIKIHDQLNFSWAYGTPDSRISTNNFSASFEKDLTFEDGLYQLTGNVDDIVKVYVDDKMIYEMNDAGSHKISEYFQTSAGTHKVRVVYTEYTGAANLSLNFVKQKGIVKEYRNTQYSTSLQEMVDKQVDAAAQIDPGTYPTYIRSDGLINIKNGVGTVNGAGWRLRDGPGTNYWHVSTVSSTTSSPYNLVILDEVKGSDGYTWYKVKYNGWQNAKPSSIERMVNPANFTNRSSTDYLQFLKLSGSTGLNVNEVNNTVLANKGILTNKASSFIQASVEYNINEAYLIAHALLETGNGSSRLATGVGIVVENDNPRLAKDGETPDKYVYNMYGINAKDSCPLECGALYAYESEWFTPEKAIVGGAYFIADGYVSTGQDTLYKMRWNPSAPGTHQYATDIGWAIKQTIMIDKVYSQLYNYTMFFDVPVFE
jgi:beta-N-acetylglucosaminidase